VKDKNKKVVFQTHHKGKGDALKFWLEQKQKETVAKSFRPQAAINTTKSHAGRGTKKSTTQRLGT